MIKSIFLSILSIGFITTSLAEEYLVIRNGGVSSALCGGRMFTREMKAGEIVEVVEEKRDKPLSKIKYAMYLDGCDSILRFEGVAKRDDLILLRSYSFVENIKSYRKLNVLQSSIVSFKIIGHDSIENVQLYSDGSFQIDGEKGWLYQFGDLILGITKEDRFLGRIQNGGLDLVSLSGIGYEPGFIDRFHFEVAK